MGVRMVLCSMILMEIAVTHCGWWSWAALFVIVILLVIVRAMVTIVKVKVHWFIGFCVLFVSGC